MKPKVAASLFLGTGLLLSSCAGEYRIAGKSTVPVLDGKVLYLRTSTGNEVSAVAFDSCQVVHGRFTFYGDVDTVCMARIYMGSESIMPVVLENGELFISVDNAGQRVTGGPLNDRLYKYLNQQKCLYNEWSELQTTYIKMVREGKAPEDILEKLGPRFKKNAEKSEKLETKFIIENAGNILGPNYFAYLCEQYPSPILTEQINEILHAVPAGFLLLPFVRNYIREAQKNPLSQPCKISLK